MRSFLLNKLVRDKIPEDMQQTGQKATVRKLDDKEFLQELARKLTEESKEFKPGKAEETLKELADVLEVIETLALQAGADFDKLRAVQAERRAKRGGFAERLFVERLDLADDDPWIDYYVGEPDRFPEVKE